MLFDGYNIVTWMVVLKLGSTGLLVSWLMNYADNIVKVSVFILLHFNYIVILYTHGHAHDAHHIYVQTISYKTDMHHTIFVFHLHTFTVS